MQSAINEARMGHDEQAIAQVRALAEALPKRRRCVDGAGRSLSRQGALRRCRGRVRQGDRRRRHAAGGVALDPVLRARRLARARRPLGRRRARSQASARAQPRSAAGAELSRLQLGRSGQEPRRGRGDARKGAHTETDGRLHRRFGRLGVLPARPLQRGRRRARAGRAAGAGRSDDQRSSGRRLLARRAQGRCALPMEPRAQHESRRQGQAGRSRARSSTAWIRPARRGHDAG